MGYEYRNIYIVKYQDGTIAKVFGIASDAEGYCKLDIFRGNRNNCTKAAKCFGTELLECCAIALGHVLDTSHFSYDPWGYCAR